MTTIRKLNQVDFQEIYDLNVYAFRLEDKEETKKWVKDCIENGRVYGAFSRGKLTSSVIVFPFEVYYNGAVLKMGGIGNVSSYPEARGQGAVRLLMEKALEEMKNKGQVLSYLAPFSYHFYRKFGYEVAFEQRRYTIMPENFGPFEAPENRVDRVSYEEEKEAIQSVYRQKMTKAIGPLKRTNWLWETKFLPSDKKKVALYRNSGGVPQGYLVYEFTGDGQNTFHINELMALTGIAERALWDYIGTHSSSFERFTYTGRSDQRLSHLFHEANVKQQMNAHMMARIVDMENFLKQFPFKSTEKQDFWLEVSDASAEWNNKVFRLSINGDDITVATEEKPVETSSYLKADIQIWTQLFMQYKTVDELRFEGLLSGSEETAQAFKALLPQGTPELYDYF
ncbi:MAG: GNAT family N-acetyltransferase [Alkalibacterium sp.]